MRFHAIVAHGQAAENRLCPQVAQGYVLPEMLIWGRLRTRQSGGPIFRQQYPFGPYVFDFYCAKIKLVIEIDGYHHGVNGQGERDEVRDRFLNARGFEILRTAHDVMAEPDDIADGIYRFAAERQQTL